MSIKATFVKDMDKLYLIGLDIYLYWQYKYAIFHTYYVCTEDVTFAKKIHYNGLSKLV